jgi:hypothetical protein
MTAALALGFDATFDDLYDREGLIRLDAHFLAFLGAHDDHLKSRLEAARAAPGEVTREAESELLVDAAPVLEAFLGELFGIQADLAALRGGRDALARVFSVKRLFVQRRAVRKYADTSALDGAALRTELETRLGGPLTEVAFADKVDAWLAQEDQHAEDLDLAARYAAWATLSEAGRAEHGGGVLFKVPHKVDAMNLVPVENDPIAGVPAHGFSVKHRRRREGFALTDKGTDVVGALDQANYCIWCHNQGKDSCSTGLKEKSGEFKKSPFGVTLAGCPLDEKISE